MLTITTAATAAASRLITVADMRAVLGLVDREDDGLLRTMIDRASDAIGRHCRRAFPLETVTETFRLDQLQQELVLARYPVVEIDSVVENGTTLDADDYEVNADNGMVTRLYGDRPCWWPISKTVITYSAGYRLPTACPPALAQACVQLVKSYYLGADRDPNVRSETVEQLTSATYLVDQLPPDVIGLLAPFRNLRMR